MNNTLRLLTTVAIDPINRLNWYQEHLSECYEWSKNQFLASVSLNLTRILLGLTTNPQQLRLHHAKLNLPSGPVVEASPIPPPAPRAIDILGLNRPRYNIRQRPLEIEVETYLNKQPTTVSSTLAYWQVCTACITGIAILLIISHRTTKLASQLFFASPWISFQSRPLPSHARGYSRLPKRP